MLLRGASGRISGGGDSRGGVSRLVWNLPTAYHLLHLCEGLEVGKCHEGDGSIFGIWMLTGPSDLPAAYPSSLLLSV